MSDARECTTLWAARECVKERKRVDWQKERGGSHGGKEVCRSGNLLYSPTHFPLDFELALPNSTPAFLARPDRIPFISFVTVSKHLNFSSRALNDTLAFVDWPGLSEEALLRYFHYMALLILL